MLFVPNALFDLGSSRKFSQSSQTSRDGGTMRCTFVHFLRGVTLHFLAPPNYLDFMTLLTHQVVLPDARIDLNTKGISIRFRSCKVVEHRDWPHRNREHEFNDGIVQVWELLSPDAYRSRYSHVDSTLGHESIPRARPLAHQTAQQLPGPPSGQISKYKMALFGIDNVTRLRCCLIVDGKPLHLYAHKAELIRFQWVPTAILSRAKPALVCWSSSKRVKLNFAPFCIKQKRQTQHIR